MSDQQPPEQQQLNSTWPKWSCELQAPAGSESVAPSVGSKQRLNCSGEMVTPLTDSAQILFQDQQAAFALRILKLVNSTPQQATFEVTGYKPGYFQNVSFQISDGVTTVEVAPMTWSVASILPKDQQPEPFGPMGPFKLSMPWWYWASIAVTILLLGLILWRYIRKHLQRKRLIERLAQHNTALSPYNQFHKDMRSLLRKYQTHSSQETSGSSANYVHELDHHFRMFLVRRLVVPAQEWSSGATVREIRRRHRKVFNEAGENLRGLLRELDKAKRESHKVTHVDCEQLVSMARKLADRIEQTKREERTAG